MYKLNRLPVRLCTLTVMLMNSILCCGQSSLPDSCTFDGFNGASSLPVGWSCNLSGNYNYSTGYSGQSARFDITGEWIQIFYDDACSGLSFYLKGCVAQANYNWYGTFKVQESANAIGWTDLASYTQLQTNGFTAYNLQPSPQSRYIRFYFANKVSGSNVALDEVHLNKKVILAQHLGIGFNGMNMAAGSCTPLFSCPPDDSLLLTFSLNNKGSAETLHISGIQLNNNDGDFILLNTSTTFSIAPLSQHLLQLRFKPKQSGSRLANLHVLSNDPNFPDYQVKLYGVGGHQASEPLEPITAIHFPVIKSYRLLLNFNRRDADHYLVVKGKANQSFTGLPQDGAEYRPGDNIGNASVIYSGQDTSVWVRNIVAGTAYQFIVYPYNGSGNFCNYKVNGNTPKLVQSAGAMIPNAYYSGIQTSSPQFVEELSKLIFPHQQIEYAQYDETIIRLWEERDTVNGKKIITCAYSGENLVYTSPFTWGKFSREHTYCHSWMPTYPANGNGSSIPERIEYSDVHHLFPVNQIQANLKRSNYPLGEVLTVEYEYLGCKLGLDANGKKVFEPRNTHKGDAARALFYMALTYNGQADQSGQPKNWGFKNPISASITYGQDQELLKKWHFQDLPDAREIARNDFIDSLQGNRNPFIDSVQYVCFIDFRNLQKIASPQHSCISATGIASIPADEELIKIFPNPANNELFIQLPDEAQANYNVRLMDLRGKWLPQLPMSYSGNNLLKLNCAKIPAGLYLLQVEWGAQNFLKKIWIE